MRKNVNLRIMVSIVMITGLLLSVSSIYLNKIVFADDPWSDIAKRQQAEEQRAMAIYNDKYQYSNFDKSKIDWSGLSSTTTDETSRGRQIDQQAQVSLENALAVFNQLHIKQLVDLQANGYQGLTNTPTDTQGRDRNTLLDQARTSSTSQAEQIISELNRIDVTYTNFEPGVTTDESTYDRQAQINKNWNTAESQATTLVNKLANINGNYANLEGYKTGNLNYVYHPGSTTNEKTSGRQLTTATDYAMEKAVLIFNDIHNKHLFYLHSSYYGLTNTPTDTQGRDRTAMLEQARETSLQNAMRVYNAYYHSAGQ